MKVLTVYSDYVCPFCYLAWPAVKGLISADWRVELRAFELRPAPLPLARPGPDRRRAWEQVIAPRAAALGLPASFPAEQPRTRKAHELAHHARRLGLEVEAHDALFAAHFVRGLDIGRIDVLVQLGAELGLEAGSVKVELDVDQYADAVAAEEAEARRLGITAVPAYVAAGGRSMHVGLLGSRELSQWLGGGDGSGVEPNGQAEGR